MSQVSFVVAEVSLSFIFWRCFLCCFEGAVGALLLFHSWVLGVSNPFCVIIK